MAYQVDKFNGTFLTSVEDGTIDTTTDIRFVGKNYAGYGEVQNENFLHILENFANTTPPPRAVIGQIWYDSTSSERRLKFYDGNQWKTASGAKVASAAPAGLSIGDFWWNSLSKQLYTYDGTNFILIGPELSPDSGLSSVVAADVVDRDSGEQKAVLKLIVGGNTIAVVSSDPDFTLATETPIQGFDVIRKGITLVNTKNDTQGVTTDNFIFYGTASNAEKLAGREVSDFLLRGQNTTFDDNGFTVGSPDNDFRIHVEQSDKVYLENQIGEPIRFRITVQQNVDEREILQVARTGLFPGSTNAYQIGSPTAIWSEIHGTSIFGNLIGNVTGDLTGVVSGTLRAFDTTVMINGTTKQIGFAGATLLGTLTGNVVGNLQGTASNASRITDIAPSIALPGIADKTSIPVRDSSGDITANQFRGISDKSDRLKIDNSATDSDPTYRSAKTTPSANTIAARDGSGNLEANLFQGTATSAQYADLAEKYLSDKDYEAGTVVMIGGTKEVTACDPSSRAIGVVSQSPAFMMNDTLENGIYIALKGRVPVKVSGPVQKGARLKSGPNGTAIACISTMRSETFAIALESNDDLGIKIVEALVL